MLTYTTCDETGGVGKTTLAANLADAHTQKGRNVLVIDIDSQQASLTYLLDKQCTAFEYVVYHRDRQRDYEVETLDQLRELAANIEEVDAP